MVELNLNPENALVSDGKFIAGVLQKDKKAEFVHLEIALNSWEINSLKGLNYLICYFMGNSDVELYFQTNKGEHLKIKDFVHLDNNVEMEYIGSFENKEVISLTIISKNSIRIPRIVLTELNPMDITFLFPIKVDGETEENLLNYITTLEKYYPVSPKYVGEFDFKSKLSYQYNFYSFFKNNDKEINTKDALERLRNTTNSPYKVFLDPRYQFDINSLRMALNRVIINEEPYCPVHNGTYCDKFITDEGEKVEEKKNKLDMICGLAFKDNSTIENNYCGSCLGPFKHAERIHYRY